MELRDKAEYSNKTGIVTVLDAELYLAKSDTIVPAELIERLKKAVAPLEDVPESQKDWHPGSDGKVLDLLHPSLFPVRYGLTRVLTEGKVPLEECISFTGKGEVTDKFDPATTGDPHVSVVVAALSLLSCILIFRLVGILTLILIHSSGASTSGCPAI